MPIDPKRSGSAASMTQYTYFPRLALTAVPAAGADRPGVFSVARRSMTRAPRLAGFVVSACPEAPLRRRSPFGAAVPAFFPAPAIADTGARVPLLLRALAD